MGEQVPQAFAGQIKASAIVALVHQTRDPVGNRLGGFDRSWGCLFQAFGQGAQQGLRADRLEQDQSGAFELMMRNLLHPRIGAISSRDEIAAIGHRMVHGGQEFVKATLVDDKVMARLRECIELAPLHNPACVAGIDAAQRMFPEAPNVVVFDTAFHQTIPAQAHVYALPHEFYAEHGIRRYGFHGISCRYVSRVASNILGRKIEDLSMVVCHLGNGVTINAVQGGRSVDTSLGFGTFGGIPMGTRSGDFDPAIIFHLVNKMGMSLTEVEKLCYKNSGLRGLSGVSNDMRDIIERASGGDERCQLALEVFIYNCRKTIGAYAAAMNKLDALVFTSGIGENSAEIRSRICAGLEILGIRIEERVNEIAGPQIPNITAPDARVATLVFPTDEEELIAYDVKQLTGNMPRKDAVEAPQPVLA